MTDQEKKALTPEEFIARKSDPLPDHDGDTSPCGDTAARGPVRTPHHMNGYGNSARSAHDPTDDPAVVTRRA